MEDGNAVEWIIQALDGSARREVLTRAAGEADTAAHVLAVLAATFGDHRGLSALLTSFHGRQQGMGESVAGYAQHLLMLTTKLNAAQTDDVNPAMFCYRFTEGLHPPSLRRDIRRYAREHDDVTFHQARPEAQRRMLQPGHFPRAFFNPIRPQSQFYAPRHSAGPRFPSHQGN